MYCTSILKLCQVLLKLSQNIRGIMSTQGQHLKNIRKSLNLSQEALGERLNVSKQYISNLEADRNVLNNEKMVSLLLDFNVNLNYLFNGQGPMFLTSDNQDDDVMVIKLKKGQSVKIVYED